MSESGDTAWQQSAESLRASVDGVATLQSLVANGEVRLEPWAAEKLKKALEDQLFHAREWLKRTNYLAVNLPLGDHWVGRVMAAKWDQRARGPGSIREQLLLYVQALTDAIEVVDQAVKVTRAADEGGASGFGRLES
ncbi:hypothetical protein NLX83_21125 [Allokutzneria sp. A3M-2-11 16]|uniref:hypothetical protein n=1 Tax=Allokutzneria sp. A3M-2-11 16 TaxID=2962043 RepID=UPI0020B859FF|nr:hypothetical protein [Allokutzneria sp. A3M-2-11 16]MCP3801770.1 hypothetical protein [Allokutzneria sp. A3M-2-11 16]